MNKTVLLIAVFMLLIMESQAQTVSDYDGNVYQTVTIGRQVWTKVNLKTTHYDNGVEIPNVTMAWGNLITGAYCNYNNSDTNVATYGRLYNWFAVADSNKLCPSRWHVPTDTDWIALATYLGNDSVAGDKLKEAGTSHWTGPNTGATNSSGFTGLPGGNRSFDYDGTFGGLHDRGHWWSSSEVNETFAWHRSLYYYSEGFYNVDNGYIKQSGFSVRCLRDSLSNSINELDHKPHIRIYPNPAADNIVIDCSPQQNLKVSIYNLTGKLILKKDLGTGTNRIDIRSFYQGIYAIEVASEDWTIYRKLIKE